MKMLYTLAAVLTVAGALPAHAASFTFAFSGTGQTGSGTLTTDGVNFTSQGYTAQTITGISGTYNGSTITALSPGTFGADDLYYLTGPSFVDGNGLGFRTAAGTQVDLFFQSNLASYKVNTLSPFASVAVTATSAAVAVPEPAAWGMMILGFGIVGVGLRRRPARSGIAWAS